MFDNDTTADLNESIWLERLEADQEMAEMTAAGNRAAALRKRGICSHGHSLGHKDPSFYDVDDIAGMLAEGHFRNRAGFDGQQSDIGEGKVLCLDCGEVYPDPLKDLFS
jgi:hypothetical protein